MYRRFAEKIATIESSQCSQIYGGYQKACPGHFSNLVGRVQTANYRVTTVLATNLLRS